MSTAVPEQDSIGLAWVKTFRNVTDLNGRVVNVTTTVTNSAAPEIPALRTVLDSHLVSRFGDPRGIQSVDTVANTIFPAALYKDPQVGWEKDDLDADAALDRAADRLFSRYLRNLPMLRRLHGANSRGTYFGRLIDWQTPKGSINQLRDRITSLRTLHSNGYGTWNSNELAIGREAEDGHEFADVNGLNMFRPSDHRGYISRGFPCMVHIDLTLFENKLHLLAVYRHQYLITKAYGNLLGLSRLHQFLAQQTGYELGELTMQAGFSDAEWNGLWNKTQSKSILAQAEAAVA